MTLLVVQIVDLYAQARGYLLLGCEPAWCSKSPFEAIATMPDDKPQDSVKQRINFPAEDGARINGRKTGHSS